MERKTEYDVEQIFVDRWSPRAMSGEAIDDADLMSLFGAARWAPSAYNAQPWRFIYAKKQSAVWDTFFDLLAEMNQLWAKNASVLVVIVSRTDFEHDGKPNPTHSFDTGSAWENLALQGSAMGLVVHGMAGFDYAKAAKDLGVPDGYKIEAMIAIGKPGDKSQLPEKMRAIESPSDRKKVSEFVFEGRFRS